ncbi:hypothetical protein SAMN05660420_03319 [Desulfuromusa kysingii]|uniref:Uncharacterized protein n=1 Tax=Desulfuromusa kysingii TaxID=37625 RepID=A0A1H4ECR6_9BACT|nr:hypothetical protein [Desulfuromusa kysingii]SEA82589.1 hypothetical protein SAMN05660420_03319 [Desulfuromusa kysingii]
MANRLNLPAGIRRWQDGDGKSQPFEGYDYSLLEDCDSAYRFTAVADVGKIETLFNHFSRFLSDESFFILEYYPDETIALRSSREEPRLIPSVYYSPYLATPSILKTITPYLSRMIHDGFVGFGIANNRMGLEFFYSEEKVLSFFTDNHLRLSHLFCQYQIPYHNALVLPADYGHDHLSLLALPAEQLPESLLCVNNRDLDASLFCRELIEQLDMYQVEEGLSFFLTRKEQEQIEALIKSELPGHDLAEVEFGGLLLDWSDFVTECEHTFDGDLWEYRQGLVIRDAIQLVIEMAPKALADKIMSIISEPDMAFKKILIDRRKRLDPPTDITLTKNRFWYHGMVRNQGSDLRRDLIRHGWFKG